MELVPEFTFTAEVNPPVEIGSGPYGNRVVFDVAAGNVTGDRINGKLLTSGGDWLLAGGDGFNRLDMRMTLATADGANIYVQGSGVMEFNDAALAAVSGERASEYEEHYTRVVLRMETGDERYAWVNQTLFVAKGRLLPGPVVEYAVARVT